MNCDKFKYFLKKSIEVHGAKYDYSLVNYINSKNKVIIICREHGEFKQRPSDHYNMKRGCPICSGRLKLTTEKFIEKATENHGSLYDYSKSEYTGIVDDILIICRKHGEFKQRPDLHMNGSGCKKCLDTDKSIGLNNFIEKANVIHNGMYDYSKSIYINNRSKIKIICIEHGEFKQSPDKHLIGRGCPKCKKSKGESEISKFLNENNIKFTQEKTIEGCLSPKNHKLKFDFYLPDYNTYIEYDGAQHFKIVEYWGGKEYFNYLKKCDSIKDNYCLNNKIALIRIDYRNIDNISSILKDKLLV